MNTYILNDLKRKWWQIALVGIICAIFIMVSRIVLVKPTMVHGPINASVIFTVDNKTPNVMVKEDLRLRGMLQSQSFIMGFVKQSSNDIDWSKLNSNWDIMDAINQFKWFQQHIFINTEDPKIYELYIMFNPNDVQDPDYTKAHLDMLISQYINYANSKVQVIDPNYSVRLVDKRIAEGDAQFQNEGFLPVKYGIIGFILGGMVMTLFVSVTAVRKYRYGR
jgi:hypothetical protein